VVDRVHDVSRVAAQISNMLLASDMLVKVKRMEIKKKDKDGKAD
jgi:hypothetical protein